jgi:hypothetical protein
MVRAGLTSVLRRKAVLAPVVAAAATGLLLVGCGPSSPSAGAAASSGGAATTPAESPTRAQQTIQQVDLGALTYVVGSGRRTVTLVGGTNTDSSGRVTKLAKTVYADADGDGFPDAAVEIAVTDGAGYEAFWYIVRWDRATQQPVLVDDPFARTFRCGDVVDSVKAASRGFTVTEHRTQGPLTDCSAQPPVALTRTVGVRDGWLAELSPNEGYGGICPHAIGDDGTHAPPAGLRIGPGEDAPLIGDTAKGAWLLLGPEYSKYVGEKKWRLVGYSTKDTTETWYSACAWMPL